MNGRQRTFRAKREAGERGSTLVLVTLFIFVLFGFAALSIDVSRVYIEKHRAHMATDAGSLAGVAKLGDPTIPTNLWASAAITEARVIANTNGVTDAEIAAAPTNGSLADIQVGQWADGIFTAGSGVVTNAVRVPARRIVTNYFGKVVGFAAMRPTVDSVAIIGAKPIPYGVPGCALAGVTNGGTFVVQDWGKLACSDSSGNWGPLDLCGVINGKNEVIAALDGPGCFSTLGQSTGTRTGFAGVEDGFNKLCDHIIVLPVTEDFPHGSSREIMLNDYIVVKVLCPSLDTGSKWKMNVQLLGRGFSDLRRLGKGPIRTLVE